LAFLVLYDANALFGALQRSILVRVGVYQTRFNLQVLLTARILDEMVDAVRRKYVDFTEAQGESLREAIVEAIGDSLVAGYEHLEPTADVADRDDRHVLAAALHANADAIITNDLGFDAAALAPHDLVAQTPDDFLTDLFDLNPTAIRQIVTKEADRREETFDSLTRLLEARGLIRFAQHLRRRPLASR